MLAEEKLLTAIDVGKAMTIADPEAHENIRAVVEAKQGEADKLAAEAAEKRAEARRLESESIYLARDARMAKRSALLEKHRMDLFAGLRTEIAEHAQNYAAKEHANGWISDSSPMSGWEDYYREEETIWEAIEVIARNVYSRSFWEECERLEKADSNAAD